MSEYVTIILDEFEAIAENKHIILPLRQKIGKNKMVLKITTNKLLSVLLSAIICVAVLSGCVDNSVPKELTATEETTITVSAEYETTTIAATEETEAITTTLTTPETTTATSTTDTELRVTTTPVTTAAPSTTTSQQITTTAEAVAKPVASIENLCNRTLIVYDGIQNFKCSENLVLYDFSDEKDVGISRDGTIQPMRMHYGITANVKDNYVYFSTYNDYPDICKVSVKSTDIVSDISTRSLKLSDKTRKLDMSAYQNGLYAIRAIWSDNNESCIFIYVTDGSVKLCSGEAMTNAEFENFRARRERIDYLLELQKITPENSIDTSNLCYPWLNQIETDLWIDLSDEITEDDWSDARKLFAFHEWMCENLAYDNYKAENGIRSFTQNDSSGKSGTWESGIGICHDWVNILLTMCRAQGIPCLTADSTGHTWNLVYINGSWVEVDMTLDIKNNVYGEDMTEWVCDGDSVYCYTAYGDEFVKKGKRKKSDDLIVLNGSLWDYDMLCGIIPYGAYELLDYYKYNAADYKDRHME